MSNSYLLMVFQFKLTRAIVHRFLSKSSIPSHIRNMSLQSAISKLRPPVRALVSSVTRDGQELGGQNETDQKEVIEWIEKTSQGNLVNENNLKVPFLVSRGFIPVDFPQHVGS